MKSRTDDRPKIVIIDDESDFLTEMERSLKPVYRVTSLYGSDWTHAQVRALEPDLILLDIHMPEQDGIELCREFRADPRLALTPIVFLTASGTNEDFIRHLRAGGTRLLNKVIDRRRLLEALAEELAAAGAAK